MTDYYAALNVAKDASQDEIKNAYKRLCLVYHPDKHSTPENQKLAKDLFPRIQTAYAVLSDPHKRAIYDIYGPEGIEAGFEVATYYGTTAELKAEFEMHKRREEEKKQELLANADVAMEVSVDATELFRPTTSNDYDDDSNKGVLGILQSVSISSATARQSIQTELSEQNTLHLGGILTSQNGNGYGHFSVGIQRQHTSDWSSDLILSAGIGRAIQIKTQKQISQKTRAMMEIGLQEISMRNGIGLIPSFNAVLQRTITPHIYGILKYNISANDTSLGTSFGYQNNGITAFTTLKFGSPTSSWSMTWKKLIMESTKVRLSFKLGLDSISFTYGLERILNETSSISLGLTLDTAEGVLMRFKYTRRHQSYSLPIWLSDDLFPEPVVYGTLVPVVVYMVVVKFWLGPYAERHKENARREARRRNQALVAERRREANAAQQLMQETLARKVEAEEAVNGLIIEEALYGELVTAANSTQDSSAVLNVTVPLQCMVRNSKLITSAYSKAGLVGFYDPIPDEPKQLRVRYRFNDRLHQVTIDDKEELKIPCRAHLIATNTTTSA